MHPNDDPHIRRAARNKDPNTWREYDKSMQSGHLDSARLGLGVFQRLKRVKNSSKVKRP